MAIRMTKAGSSPPNSTSSGSSPSTRPTQRAICRDFLKADSWDKAFLAYVQQLEKTKPVLFCGDLNVAHQEIDLANPKPNKR